MRYTRDVAYAVGNILNQHPEDRGRFKGSEKEFGLDNYLNTIMKYIHKIERVCDMAYDKVTMNNGEQPLFQKRY